MKFVIIRKLVKMEKLDKSITSMQLALRSFNEAKLEWLAQQKALQDQIKSLEENNKGLVLENKSLSAKNTKMKSKMELLDSQLLESSKKMSESIANATELERFLIKKERQVGLKFCRPSETC